MYTNRVRIEVPLIGPGPRRSRPIILGSALMLAFNVSASGYSLAPSDDVLVLVALLPLLAGITTGCLAGWRRWHFWKSLGIVALLVLAILLGVFLRPFWIMFAPVAVPALLLIHCFLHVVGHIAWAWVRKRRARRDTAVGPRIG